MGKEGEGDGAHRALEVLARMGERLDADSPRPRKRGLTSMSVHAAISRSQTKTRAVLTLLVRLGRKRAGVRRRFYASCRPLHSGAIATSSSRTSPSCIVSDWLCGFQPGAFT